MDPQYAALLQAILRFLGPVGRFTPHPIDPRYIIDEIGNIHLHPDLHGDPRPPVSPPFHDVMIPPAHHYGQIPQPPRPGGNPRWGGGTGGYGHVPPPPPPPGRRHHGRIPPPPRRGGRIPPPPPPRY